jgi:hypothetical protein
MVVKEVKFNLSLLMQQLALESMHKAFLLENFTSLEVEALVDCIDNKIFVDF